MYEINFVNKDKHRPFIEAFIEEIEAENSVM